MKAAQADRMDAELLSPKVRLVPGTRPWISACIARPERLAAHLRVWLAHDWDHDSYLAGAPYVLEDMREGEEGWWYWWLVERPAQGHGRPALVGWAGFKGPPTAGGNVEVLYNVAPSARGRGLASESVRLLVDWAFGNPRVRRVIATIDPANLASQRVVQRCGFSRVEGDCDEDEVVYALERSAWGRMEP